MNNQVISKKLILEKAEQTGIIRQIVRDIITIYKKETEGDFYLPEDLEKGTEGYISSKVDITVELNLKVSNDVEDYVVDGNFYKNESIIEIEIIYNPKQKNNSIFNLIGELNELVAHEMRHLYQYDNEMFDLDTNTDDLPPFEYYSRPEEIDSQVYGFRRMKNVTKKPFEELVKNWFKTHKEIHQLNSEEEMKIISMILDYNSKI